jgi:putative ABC transport system permease protein
MIRHLFKLVWNRKRSSLLVIAEIFLSFLVILVVVTATIAFVANKRRPLGFAPDNVWIVAIEVNQRSDDTWSEAMTKNFDTLMREVSQTPGIVSAAGSLTPAYTFASSNGSWRIGNKNVSLDFDEVTDDFAKTMGLKVTRGRWFSREDDASQFRPVVLDENAAKALFGDEDPIGKKYGTKDDGDSRIVGVVQTYRKSGELSFPLNFVFKRVKVGSNESRPPRNLLIRVAPGTGVDFQAMLLKRLQAAVPEYTYTISTMREQRETWARAYRAPVVTGAVISSFLILMVALGLTGVLWQNVTRRTRELGLRRAVGAEKAKVRRQILAEVAVLTTMAVALGVVLALHVPALGLLPRLSNVVFTLGLVGSLAVVYTLTLLCGLYPSWLAARVQPAEALHYE